MVKISFLPRMLIVLAGIIFLYFVFTDKEQNWLYNTSLGIIYGATIVSMIIEWRAGNKKSVKARLITYAVLLAVILILALIFKQ